MWSKFSSRIDLSSYPIPCMFPGIRLLVSTVCSRNLRNWPNGPARSGQETSSLSARSSPEARPPTSAPCPDPPRSRQGGSPERCQCLSQAAGVAYCVCQWPSQLTESGAISVLRDHATGKTPPRLPPERFGTVRCLSANCYVPLSDFRLYSWPSKKNSPPSSECHQGMTSRSSALYPAASLSASRASLYALASTARLTGGSLA